MDCVGPTPAEIDAAAWSTITEDVQKNHCAGTRTLSTFTRESICAHITPTGDDRTNIIDQNTRTTYALDSEYLRQLFIHLEACRIEGSAVHFSERQGTPAAPKCGIMIDYDIITNNRKPVLTDRHYYRFAGALVATLQRDLDFTRHGSELRIHVMFIIKPEVVSLNTTPPTYKYGLHMLIPGIAVGRAYKKWLMKQFCTEPSIASSIQELGVVGDPTTCLDQHSSSVPVFFIGSCKRGSVPYTLGAALEVTLDLGCGDGWAPPPVIRKLTPTDLAGYNLVAELSLTTEADYDDGRPPLVKMEEYEVKPDVSAKVQDWGDRSADNIITSDELLLAEHSLSTLTLHDAEAKYLHALLDLLSPEYYTDRGKWRDVVFAIANTNINHKPLAIWFSQKCPQKWSSDGLDALWDDAIAKHGGERPLTIRSISFWARSCDSVRYAEITERSYFTTLITYVYKHGGKLEHAMIAKILKTMLGTKFCVDIDKGPRGSDQYCWFEFVLPDQAQKPGEVWKWRKEVEPSDIHIYISEKLTHVCDQISDHIDAKYASATTDDEGKYYKKLGKAFASSKLRLYNDTFKNGVIRQASNFFLNRNFICQLDKLPDLFGTRNGVLKLGPQCTLIDHYHEYAISKFSPVAYVRFNPLNPDPWHKLVLDAIADIIVEPDARDWILFHAAQGLSGEPKEGLMLLWEGGGQNGKTSFLRWVAKALGPYADKFNIQLMCCEREDADRPNSAVMRFKHLNYAYSEESNKAQSLNVARMKEMVNAGEISGRELHSKQETFTMKANFVAASQYSFIVNTTDHGTWRRLRHYTSKAKFRAQPDPSNPLEKLDDQRFVRRYPTDPQFQSAFLGILVHYYERLQLEYNGELKKVRAPTIESETESFRISQDALHRWISQYIVVSPSSTTDYPLGVLGNYYHEWYCANIERKRYIATDVIKEIESSAIGKYLRPAMNRTLMLKGCRVLTADEMTLRPDESLIADVEHCRIVAPAAAAAEDQWWLGKVSARVPVVDDGDYLRDDAKLMRNDRRVVIPMPQPQLPQQLTDDDIMAIFEEPIGLEDVYDTADD